MNFLPSFLLTLSLLAITSGVKAAPRPKLTDPNATPETKALYRNLHKLAKKHILIGHQHATEYGHGWNGDTDRSDVKSVTGSNRLLSGSISAVCRVVRPRPLNERKHHSVNRLPIPTTGGA